MSQSSDDIEEIMLQALPSDSMSSPESHAQDGQAPKDGQAQDGQAQDGQAPQDDQEKTAQQLLLRHSYYTESVMFAVYITACGFTAAITSQLLYTESVMFAVYI